MMSNWGHEAKMVDIIEAQNYAACLIFCWNKTYSPKYAYTKARPACGRCPGLLG
jgi:hypothetical protein